MNKRASVKKLIIHLKYPDGLIEQRIIDGQDAVAIVNSDRVVEQILAPFYHKVKRHLKTRQLVKKFGPGITAAIGDKEEVLITPGLVKQLWHSRNEEGLLPAFLIKKPQCPLEIAGLRTGISLPQPDADPRPQIINLTIQVVYPDGKSANTILLAGEFEGIFWNERASKEILAPFYDTVERRISSDEMINLCGPSVTSIIGHKKEISITPKLIADLWDLEDENGFLPAFMIKIPMCSVIMERNRIKAQWLPWRKAA